MSIAGALAGIFSQVAGLIFNVIGTITGAILALAVGIFNWVTSESFISLSYTNPDTNPFIKVGWGLTRDLTNIIFIVILIAIGLGTALRIRDYEAKKTLPRLIIIALLINFTPVILGVIVDATNIVMNFFMQGGFSGGNSFVSVAFSQWGNMQTLAGGQRFWDPTASSAATGAAIGSLVLIIFDLVAAFIYFVFALLFAMRYMAIWILVILSPLAFALSLIPAGKGFFKQWWNQFLQWSFIGIIAAFFLYLSDQMIRIGQSGNFAGSMPPSPGGGFDISGVMNNILPYGVSLFLLFTGLAAAMSSSAQGAEFITSRATKARKAIQSFAKARGGSWLRERATESRTIRAVGEGLADVTTPGSNRRGFGGWAMRNTTGLFAEGLRKAGRAMAPGTSEANKKDIGEAESNAAKQEYEMQRSRYRSARTDTERIGILNSMVKAKHADKALTDLFQGNPNNSELSRLYNFSQHSNDNATLRAAFPEVARVNSPGQQMGDIFDKIKPADYGILSRDTVRNNDAFLDQLITRGTRNHARQLVDNHEADAITRIGDRLRVLAANAPGGPQTVSQYLEHENPNLYNYFVYGAGRDLFPQLFPQVQQQGQQNPPQPNPPQQRQNPPPGVPPNWRPGPGGIWIP